MNYTPIVAIICLTIIEGFALCKGVNGKLMTLIASLIAGLGGFILGQVF